ncbi:MarR family winged helix-turn-helix transcriptional regulator [Bradyrhizobium sp. 41S5]|uniref:MarR family winged helix-turn-helix transcriptional regulator n=1 Tax=Bradyrhizobium sp. 41S5 TaxID=1404443 RepID=UPI001E2D4C09|nr:MarR family winged helix-turn-helix transcriptional regulator [Bradyrhizobium sp. 41S5]UFX46021.1 MarR family winged helix-turn-helix transcriptional regulator [Bradyrhizobium sp. 41S5]
MVRHRGPGRALCHNVADINCCRQQQSSPPVPGALALGMASKQQTSRKAAGKAAAIRRPQARAANGGTTGGDTADDIGLDALIGHAGYAVRRFQLWIFQDFIKTLATVAIRPTQYSVMTVIWANPGLSQMAVAKRLGIERARLVHLLDSLEERDFVSRIPSATDRRSHALHLTKRGKTALARFKRLAAEHERHVAEKIGKENREQLLQILACFT